MKESHIKVLNHVCVYVTISPLVYDVLLVFDFINTLNLNPEEKYAMIVANFDI